MRSEKEMYDLILDIAKRDERIRAVYMNGSRANPNIKKDIFQDYDIVYVVTETKTFIEDKNGQVILENQLFFKNQINWIKCKELILTLIMDILI